MSESSTIAPPIDYGPVRNADVDRLCAALQRIDPSPETIIAFLQRTGIMDGDGRLTYQYQQPAPADAENVDDVPPTDDSQ